jgi:hypothetical protein
MQPQPENPNTPRMNSADQRPAPVRALGAAGIFIAVLGLLAVPLGAWNFYLGNWTVTRFDRTPQTLWLLVSSLGGGGLSLLLFVAAIGLLALRRWARWAMILYAIGSLALGIVGGYLYARAVHNTGTQPELMRGVGAFFELCGWFIGFVFAVFALYYMTRRPVISAFNQRRLPPSD